MHLHVVEVAPRLDRHEGVELPAALRTPVLISFSKSSKVQSLRPVGSGVRFSGTGREGGAPGNGPPLKCSPWQPEHARVRKEPYSAVAAGAGGVSTFVWSMRRATSRWILSCRSRIFPSVLMTTASFSRSTGATVRRYETTATTSSGEPRHLPGGHEPHGPAVLLDAVANEPRELAVRVRGAEAGAGDVRRDERPQGPQRSHDTAAQVGAVACLRRATRHRVDHVLSALDDGGVLRCDDVRNGHVVDLVEARVEARRLDHHVDGASCEEARGDPAERLEGAFRFRSSSRRALHGSGSHGDDLRADVRGRRPAALPRRQRRRRRRSPEGERGELEAVALREGRQHGARVRLEVDALSRVRRRRCAVVPADARGTE